MINLRKYKSLVYMITIFSLIIFTFSLFTSIVISDYRNIKEANNFKDNNTKAFKFDDSKKESKKIDFKSLVQVLDSYKDSDIYLELNPIPKYLANNTLFGKAIYYNYNIDNNFPIIEGENFTLEQMNSTEKLVLVGKNLKDNIILEDGMEYFTIDDVKYRVLGILGSDTKKTGFDDIFIINMKSMDYYSDNRSTWSLNVSLNEDLNSILDNYKNIGIKNNSILKLVEVNNQNNKITIKDIFENYNDFMYIFKMISGFGILNLIIVVFFWFDRSIKEIGIRKAYGATNLSIAKFILKRYELSTLISISIGLLLHYILKGVLSSMFPMFSFDIYLENVLIATIIFMFIGSFAATIPFIKAIKVQPIIIMKGRLK